MTWSVTFMIKGSEEPYTYEVKASGINDAIAKAKVYLRRTTSAQVVRADARRVER